MTATPKVNYTESMVQTLLARYEELGNAGIEQIAQELNRPKRSVISKLVREGVYTAPEKPAPKAKDEGPTKKEILRDIEAAGFSVEGLEPATKDALTRVLALVANQAAEAA